MQLEIEIEKEKDRDRDTWIDRYTYVWDIYEIPCH